MFVVIWRYSQGSPWTLHKDPLPTEQEAREVINKYGRYDMAKRQFRIASVGDADSWRDPVAEQQAREAE